MDGISLIAGLGNPGRQHEQHRHNAGAMFLAALCRQYRAELKEDKKFSGLAGTASIASKEVRLIFPTTYMNNSGQAVGAIASYFKIPPQQILVAYDELDLPLGTTRLKSGGGAGGHNGIRDIIAALGSPDFLRLRLGIGHPGSKELVTNHVLNNFSRDEAIVMSRQLDEALDVVPLLVEGRLEAAMLKLHTRAEK